MRPPTRPNPREETGYIARASEQRNPAAVPRCFAGMGSCFATLRARPARIGADPRRQGVGLQIQKKRLPVNRPMETETFGHRHKSPIDVRH